MRIQGNRLSSFMEAYLQECEKRDLTSTPVTAAAICRDYFLRVARPDLNLLTFRPHNRADPKELPHPPER